MKIRVDNLKPQWYHSRVVCILRKKAWQLSVRVQFVLSDSEYEELKKIVEEKGVSISKYVKDKVFYNSDSFEKIWEEFCDKLGSFPKNIEFNVANVMTQERWRKLDKSTKLSLARLFNKKVRADEFSDVEFIERSSANVSLYKRV